MRDKDIANILYYKVQCFLQLPIDDSPQTPKILAKNADFWFYIHTHWTFFFFFSVLVFFMILRLTEQFCSFSFTHVFAFS